MYIRHIYIYTHSRGNLCEEDDTVVDCVRRVCVRERERARARARVCECVCVFIRSVCAWIV